MIDMQAVIAENGILRDEIARLRTALIEERARRIHQQDRASNCAHYGANECDNGHFCDFLECPHKEDFVSRAGLLLHSEGKI